MTESLWTELVASAHRVWVRELDFTEMRSVGYLRADLILDSNMGHPEGIAREVASPGMAPLVAPGRYRAILCLIPIKEQP